MSVVEVREVINDKEGVGWWCDTRRGKEVDNSVYAGVGTEVKDILRTWVMVENEVEVRKEVKIKVGKDGSVINRRYAAR